MKREAKELRFKMFGRFSASYGEDELKLDKSGTTSMIQLLAMLLCSPQGIARETLLRNLYGGKDLVDRNNNFRVTVFKLRKMLMQAGLPEGKYVSAQNNIYTWESDVPVTCDLWEFREFAAGANAAQAAGDFEKELTLRRKACMLYTDQLLGPLSCEQWVAMESVSLKQDYTNCLKRLCSLLDARGAYREIADWCSVAERIYPYDEWQLVRIDALTAMNQYDEALTVYQRFTDRYYEDLGIAPTEEMQLRVEKIHNSIQRQRTTADEIYWGLVEKPVSTGAAYVSYPNFIDRFRFLQRLSERSGESNFLVVATMLQKSGKAMDTVNSGSREDETIRDILRDSLRRTDTFTKYNGSQYLMLLVGIDLESVKIVTKRIDQRLLRVPGGIKLACQCRALPVQQPELPDREPGWNFRDTEAAYVPEP